MAMHQLTLALYQPDIPQNAGTMLRACACLGFQAAIIGPTGFPAADRNFRRAGMDYLDQLTISRHISFESFQHWRKSTQQGSQARRLILLSTKAEGSYLDLAYQPDDILMVGRESAGVPERSCSGKRRCRENPPNSRRALTQCCARRRNRYGRGPPPA